LVKKNTHKVFLKHAGMQTSRTGLCAELLTGMGREEGLDLGLPPPFSPWELGSNDILHLSAPSPSLSSFNALYKYCHFLVTRCAICVVFTILFTFKLPLLYNCLDLFTFTLKSNPPGCRAVHWEALEGFLTGGSTSLPFYFKLDVC